MVLTIYSYTLLIISILIPNIGARYEECMGNNCIVIYDQLYSWINAYTSCGDENLRLVSIETEAKLNFIQRMINSRSVTKPEGYWTSGSDQFSEGAYVWMSNGKRFTPTMRSNFSPTEPSNVTYENCIILWKYGNWKFGDNRCELSNQNHFICEYYK